MGPERIRATDLLRERVRTLVEPNAKRRRRRHKRRVPIAKRCARPVKLAERTASFANEGECLADRLRRLPSGFRSDGCEVRSLSNRLGCLANGPEARGLVQQADLPRVLAFHFDWKASQSAPQASALNRQASDLVREAPTLGKQTTSPVPVASRSAPEASDPVREAFEAVREAKGPLLPPTTANPSLLEGFPDGDPPCPHFAR